MAKIESNTLSTLLVFLFLFYVKIRYYYLSNKDFDSLLFWINLSFMFCVATLLPILAYIGSNVSFMINPNTDNNVKRRKEKS